MIELSGNKYVVTGGAGFIGSHIAEELVRRGKQVIVIDNGVAGKRENLESWWNPKLCTFLEADIGELRFAKIIQKNMKGADAVFHCAASKCTRCFENPLVDLQTNAWGSLSIFSMAYEAGAKVVHASTGSVNDGSPVSFYGVSKLAAENYLGAIESYFPNFRYTILRYYHVYGPRQDNSDKGGVIPIFIRKCKEGNPIIIYGDGEQIRRFTWVKDVVNVNFWVAENEKTDSDIYNVVADVRVTINELAEKVKQFTGVNKHYPIIHEAERPGDIKRFIIHSDFIGSDGPSFMNDFDAGLKETIKSYE